jgi:phosphomannomutase
MGAFHAYDIRGIYNIDFNKNDVYSIGYFLPDILHAGKILIGRDARHSSPEIFSSLSAGIMDAGCDVYDAGLTTTPMIYWATANYNFDGSVMITASHNGKEYNGLKVSREKAFPVGYDTGLNEIERKILNQSPMIRAQKTGKLVPFHFKDDYISFQRNYLGDYSDLMIAVDCSNGMAGLLIRELLGNHPVYINEIPDGSFPNHDPNPLQAKNLTQLKNMVRSDHFDIGVIFDGDADRVMFVDERGEFISPDLLIAVLGHYFLNPSGPVEQVLQDIRTSKAVTSHIEKMGGKVHMWRVGRAFAAQKLREINGIYGGELAGHYYFRDFFFSDSGIMACLILLGLFNDFKKSGRTVSQVVSTIGSLANSGEINFRIEQQKAAMEALKNYFLAENNPIAFFDFDGYRIEFADWWFNIRPSNTEPCLRLIVEANTNQLLNEKLLNIKKILNNYS